MPLAKSSLSIAIQGFADFLATQFTEDVTITVDTPQKAQEQAKGASTDVLNIFVYRLAPSGFHADAAAGEPGFIRAHILLTPFSRAQDDDGATDLDLRVLGHALAVLHSNPVIPLILPAAPGSAEAAALAPQTTYYQLQAVFQAPAMEELNHIWTTQGGDLAYRLSAGFELALIPVEPLEHTPPPADVTAAVIDLSPDLGATGASAMGVTGPDGAGWVPVLMFSAAGALSNALEIAPGAAEVTIALTGEPGADAEIIVEWTRAGGDVDIQAPAARAVSATSPDDPAALITLSLAAAGAGDSARIYARPAAPAGAAHGNVLMLSVGDA